MKNNVVTHKKNIFEIIKDAVGGSFIEFFKALGSTEPDDMQDEVISPSLKAQVAGIEGTTLDGNDFIEVDAGKTVKFDGINAYRRNVDVNKVIEAHNKRMNQNEQIQEKGTGRTRGAR